MYARNTIGKRRAPGWTERRRYFRRLIELARTKALKDEEAQKPESATEKD